MHAVRFSLLLSAPFLAALETQIFMNNPRNCWLMDPLPHVKFLWLFGGSEVCLPDSATATQLSQRLSSVCVLCLPLPGRLSTVPNFTSILWMLFFIQPLDKNSVLTAKHCNFYIYTDFWSKYCLLYWTALKLAHLLDTASKLASFSMSVLKDEKFF